tara:strand:+ start:15557 stop:16222 length:666 start_codon:yes stop_codon:yes gene_type:complete
MPVDPKTGENLPYPGEPGYDPNDPRQQAAMEAEAMPPGGEAMPPGGEEMPMEGEVEEVDQMMADDAAMRADAIAASAPEPSKPYTVRAIQTLVDQFNDTIDALGGEDLPEVEFMSPEGEKRWEQPLPPSVFVPLVALTESLKLIGGGEYHEKYGFDPMELTDDTALRKASGQLGRMAKDKDLSDMMQQPIGGAEQDAEMPEEMPPPPGGFSDEDDMLAAEM